MTLRTSPLFFLLVLAALTHFGCQTAPVGLSISGALAGFSESSIHLDRSMANNTFSSVISGDLAPGGSFKLESETHPGPGVYRLRTGGASALIVLNGQESSIKINADNQTLPRASFDIEGAPLTAELHQLISDQNSARMPLPQLSKRLEQTSDPYVTLAFAQMALRGRPDFTDQYISLQNRLKSSYPNEDWSAFDQVVNKMKTTRAMRQSQNAIQEGMPAPEIAMPDVNGKTRKLSDLKGKLVLIDFWASWCGPCRRANPHVVEMYHKYKKQGFDVFSVSLDGIDKRSAQRYGLDAEQLAQQKESGKQRWLNAIKQDQLVWPHHVSDLNKWDTKAAQQYGVTSIPRTFLVGKDGKIAAVNPRGNLEEMIKKNI